MTREARWLRATGVFLLAGLCTAGCSRSPGYRAIADYTKAIEFSPDYA